MAFAPADRLLAAQLILAFHTAIIGFNLFGLIVIPIGAWRGWRFVHAPTWRWLHVASLGVVALQAVAGRACFLTIWQNDLTGDRGGEPLIMHWVKQVVFWPLPMWVFDALYVALFVYVIVLTWLVPPRRLGAAGP